MSISAIAAPQSDNVLYLLNSSDVAPASSTATSSSTAANLSDPTDSSDSTSALEQDLAALLKALVSGNLSEAKSALATLEGALKSSSPTSSSATTASATSGLSPLQQLVAALSKALNSGNTSAALTDVASFLVNLGQSSGNLVNVSA